VNPDARKVIDVLAVTVTDAEAEAEGLTGTSARRFARHGKSHLQQLANARASQQATKRLA
jgi:hypothetical protein